MPVFVEDPTHFSKSRLKSDLIANSVALPPSESRKEVYVELYVKNIDQQHAADFSSDEEDHLLQDVVEEEKEEDPEMLESSGLTDEELKATLLQHGVTAGPIVASTRALYERKLTTLQGDEPILNQYSDHEEEEEEEEEKGSEQAAEEVTSRVDQDLQESSQASVADVLKEMFPDAAYTPSGISATRRRPIKGAAGRPVQHQYHQVPVTPVTPVTPGRGLVPLSAQVVIFLVVASCLFYLVYAYIEGGGSGNQFVALLDDLSLLLSDGEEGLSLQSETLVDTPPLDTPSAQE